MRADELLASLKARFKGNKANEIIIGAEDIADWPEGVFIMFEQGQFLVPADHANYIECPRCEEACFMPVEILPAVASRPARAFIVCNQRDDVGRVEIEFSRLRQWKLSLAALEKIESHFILSGNGKNDTSLKKSKAPAAFRAALRDLLVEVSRRAKNQGLDFSSASMPGRKVDFQAIADKFDSVLEHTPRTFDDYLEGVCTFRRGARKTDFYVKLFPECFK